jgi:putative lipoic acid-binding regulatory protein
MSEPGPADAQAAERERALELLRSTHRFPVDYHLSVITLADDEVCVRLRVAVEAGSSRPLGEQAYQRVASSGGKYVSHRFTIRVDTAEAVLELYARVKTVEGVIQIF